jgi:electron transport complex protein RnfC
MNIRSFFGILPQSLPYSSIRQPVHNHPLPGNAALLFYLDQSDSRTAVRIGEKLKTGQGIFAGTGQRLGFSTVTGTVSGIREISWYDRRFTEIGISDVQEDDIDPSCVRIDAMNVETSDVADHLRNAGSSPGDSAIRKCEICIINFLESDIGFSIGESVLREHAEILKRGLPVLQEITGCNRVILAVPPGLDDEAKLITLPAHEVRLVKNSYPNGMSDALKRFIFGGKAPECVVISPEELVSMVMFLERGYPSLDKIISVVGPGAGEVKNIRARIGTPVSSLLSGCGITATEGDRIVLGGMMRGTAIYRDHPVSSWMDALLIQRGGGIHVSTDEPCVGCGKCARICPESLQVNLLSRYSEYALFERCADLGVDRCIDCGLCSYVCISRRPISQQLSLAKRQLEQMGAMNE